MFQLRKETDYAIQFLKTLHKQKKGNLSLKEMSDHSDISFLFLQKIARKLKRAGLIESAHGATGGYFLKVPAGEITLKKIIEVMEGRCGLVECNSNNKCACLCGNKCCVSVKLSKINQAILKVLEKTKLKDL